MLNSLGRRWKNTCHQGKVEDKCTSKDIKSTGAVDQSADLEGHGDGPGVCDLQRRPERAYSNETQSRQADDESYEHLNEQQITACIEHAAAGKVA